MQNFIEISKHFAYFNFDKYNEILSDKSISQSEIDIKISKMIITFWSYLINLYLCD